MNTFSAETWALNIDDIILQQHSSQKDYGRWHRY